MALRGADQIDPSAVLKYDPSNPAHKVAHGHRPEQDPSDNRIYKDLQLPPKEI